MDTTNTAYEQRTKALFQKIARLRVEDKEIRAQAERVLAELAELAELEATPKLTCLQLTEAYAQLEQAEAVKPLLRRVGRLLDAKIARLGIPTPSQSCDQTYRLYSRLQNRIYDIIGTIDEDAYIQLILIDPTLLPY